MKLNVGDTLTLHGSDIDDRNWWQRVAPKWLGGRDDPTAWQFLVITGEASSGPAPVGQGGGWSSDIPPEDRRHGDWHGRGGGAGEKL